ncbi:GNAT family N-acetyltransferase [Oribacterium sp. FC2011]|uniref:GNAT family N-acetyltransferase n=1 Tax=Oribacterium sp. FC2011 TaxID=1408311 RepID=UPI0004E12E8D|nr:GNAT family N-acetyltransferase [Oribacterium sp. FC2011]
MIIRLMTIEDYEKVYQLWLSCSGMGLNNLDDSKDGIAKYLDRNPDTCFVAEKSDEIIGVIISGHDGRRGFIYHTAVNPEYRNQGIAKMLVEAAMDALKANGINKVALVVFDRNKDGNAFWEKVGFSVREDLVYRNKTISELIRIDT